MFHSPRTFHFCLALFALLAFCGPARGQTVYISELLAENQTNAKVDEDGDHSDWLEIWNSGASTVSLNGWYLTDNAGDLRKWQFPVTTPAVSLADDREGAGTDGVESSEDAQLSVVVHGGIAEGG